MATTQKDRILRIDTPFGEDYLMLNAFTANEEISRLFTIEAELVHAEEKEGIEPTIVDPAQLLGQGVTLKVRQSDGTERFFNGIVNRMSHGTRRVRFTYYNISVVPFVWILTQNIQSRIFQQKSVPEILKEVLEGFETTVQLQGTYEKRNYCVQYQESDWDFIARLMEEEGIYFYFQHSNGLHKMILADTPQSHQECPGKSTIPYYQKAEGDDLVTAIRSFHKDYNLQTGKITVWDHNFQTPTTKLDAQQPSRFNVGGNQALEQYIYPGGYSRKYDGIDKSGSEQAGEIQHLYTDKAHTAEVLMQALDVELQTAVGVSDCPSLTAGHRFSLTGHPNKTANGAYVITSIRHNGVQSPSYVSDESVGEAYTNSFSALDHGSGSPPFRPKRSIPKPILHGSQTATVVGPGGEEIFTDKYGRVKVQFHWDRAGKNDSNSACWLRVVQPWAGNKWGTMFIPRIGMEVLVHFLDGNPDQPIITGSVYNPGSMPPYALPDHKTKSTIKTNSTTGGGGFNELRFEDKKGSEQVFIHAEKNMDIRVKSDRMETIGNDRHLTVHRHKFEEVKKDKHVKVGGDLNEHVEGTASLKADSDIHQKASSSFAAEGGSSVHIKAGMSAVIEAGVSLTLKVGGNFVNINPGGVFIQGTMVMLNSGGAAGTGAGVRPNTPKKPKEADNAEPGSNPPSPPTSPPEPPGSMSPLAQSFQKAAENGTPFCNPCPGQ